MEHIAREVEILNLERAHSAGVYFGKRDAAVGDDGAVEAHESWNRERRAFQYVHEPFALFFGHTVGFYILVGKCKESENGFG